MSSRALYRLVRIVIVIMALFGAVVCIYIIPILSAEFSQRFINTNIGYYAWIIFLWMTVIPCLIFLIYIWKVSTAIKQDVVFTYHTAHLIKASAIILLSDVCFFFIGNVIFMLLDLNHPQILLLSLITLIFGVSLAMLAAILSRYLTKAADLQDEVDSTI